MRLAELGHEIRHSALISAQMLSTLDERKCSQIIEVKLFPGRLSLPNHGFLTDILEYSAGTVLYLREPKG